MRFPIDAQLPPALARQIAASGHTSEHVADLGLAQASDAEIRAYATRTGAVIVTKDEDFPVDRILRSGPSIIWIRMGNTRRVDLLQRFDREFASIVAALERGESIVEIS